MKPDWWPSWEGETIVIVAGGPSARQANLELVRGRAKVMAINNAGLTTERLKAIKSGTTIPLCPWADILYSCDAKWWAECGGVPEFTGLKLSSERTAPTHDPDVRLVTCMKPDDRLYLEPLGTIGWGGNGGFHCLNLAVQFKAAKIILVGYDMRVDYGLHWHGKHSAAMNNPSLKNIKRWRLAVDGAAKTINALGIQVINVSPVSLLTKFPKMSLSEALEC